MVLLCFAMMFMRCFRKNWVAQAYAPGGLPSSAFRAKKTRKWGIQPARRMGF
jgi:hypothetical protein